MSGPPGPTPRRVALIVTAAAVAGLLRALLGAGGPTPARAGLVVDLVVALGVAFVASAVARAPRDARSRRAWWLLTAFPLAWAVAPVAWLVGLPEVADAARALAVLLVGASWWFAARAGGTLSRVRLAIDGAIGSAAVVAVGWPHPLADAWHGAGGVTAGLGAVGVPVAMVGVIVLGAGVTLTEMPTGRRARPSLFLLGMLVLVLSDIAWTWGLPAFWAAGWTTYALTIRTQLDTTPRVTRAPTRGRVVYLPYALIAPSAVALALRAVDSIPEPPQIAAGLTIVALLVARQHATLLENDRLFTRLEETERRLRYQATHDALTGLPGRTQLYERLDATSAAQEREPRPVALAFLDVDLFKGLNDRYGHATGDAVLIEVAARLARATRGAGADSFAARLGGDEFAVLVSGEHASDPTALASLLAVAVEGPVTVGTATVDVAVSIGVTTVAGGFAPSDLLHQADLAMYQVKRTRQTRYGPPAVRLPGPSAESDSGA